jgi:hypothetical protein
MKKFQIALIVIFLFLLVFVSFSLSQSQDIKKLKAGMPNTVTLSNGEVVYDLNGEWDAIYDNKDLGTNKDVVKITQEGNKFVGIKLIGNIFLGKGKETIKGELEGDGFKSLYGYARTAGGWTLSKGRVSDRGNKIVMETERYSYTFVLTLTRK